MIYSEYSWKVCQLAYEIAVEQGSELIDIFAPDSAVRREAVDRLYVDGLYHDLMTRYPNAYVRSQFIASSQEEIHVRREGAGNCD